METTKETYWVDFGAAKLYYTVLDGSTVISRDRATTLSKDKLLDFLAIAKELGHKTGKI